MCKKKFFMSYKKKKIYDNHQLQKYIKNLQTVGQKLFTFQFYGHLGKDYFIVGHPVEILDSAGGILYGKIN